MYSGSATYMFAGSSEKGNRRRCTNEDDVLSPVGTTSTESTASGGGCSVSPSSSPDSLLESSEGQVEPQSALLESGVATERNAASKASSQSAKASGKTKDMPYSSDDLQLVERFYTLADVRDSHPDTLKLILRTVYLMRSCGYPMQDICCVLAHASLYFELLPDSWKKTPVEAGRMAVLYIYLAHSYVQDEHCPLKYWHRYLFSDFCDVKTLDRGVMNLLKLRGYLLRVDASEARSRALELYSRRARR